jgi:uncharacterized membrane protein YkoI
MLAKALQRYSDWVQSGAANSQPMKRPFALFVAALSLGAMAAPAAAFAPKADQQQARKQMSDGKVMSLRQIEGIILPKMKGMEYLGPEYFEDSKIYRLKFIDDGDVIFVDVDARTGAIVRRR